MAKIHKFDCSFLHHNGVKYDNTYRIGQRISECARENEIKKTSLIQIGRRPNKSYQMKFNPINMSNSSFECEYIAPAQWNSIQLLYLYSLAEIKDSFIDVERFILCVSFTFFQIGTKC